MTWVVVLAALTILTAGVGLLFRRLVVPGRLPLGLVLPLGFASVVVVGAFAAMASVPAAIPVVVVAAGAAYGYLGVARIDGGAAAPRRPSPETRWGLGALAVIALIYVVAVAGTGQATFAGYGMVGDPAIHLVGADALLGGGDWARQPGAFRAFFDGYYGTGYPTGAASTLAIATALVGGDPARVLHPLLVFAMVVFGSALWVLLRLVVPQAWLRAVVVVLASVPSLTFSFVMMSSLKEVFAIAMLATSAAACSLLWPHGGDVRRAGGAASRADDASPRADDPGPGAPDPGRATGTSSDRWAGLRVGLALGVGPAAVVASIGAAAVVYVAPVFAIVLLALWASRGLRPAAMQALWAVAVVVLLAVPSIIGLGAYLDVSGAVLTTQGELGNLFAGPLVWREVLGVWLGTDFRTGAAWPNATRAAGLLVLVLVALGVGVVTKRVARDRRFAVVPLLAWLLAVAVATVAVLRVGSPWADAKGLAIAAPAVMAAAGVGLAALWSLGVAAPAAPRVPGKAVRVVAVLAGALLVGAVGGSVALATYGVGAAPRERFAELRAIDDRFAEQGPIVVSEWEEFSRHALRKTAGRFAGDPYFPVASIGAFGFSRDGDDLDPAQVQAAPLVLVRTGPATSRPPSNFEPAWRGRYYEVWRRDPSRPAPRVHQGIGTFEGGGVAAPACTQVRALAAQARPGEWLVAAARPAPSTEVLSTSALPAGWTIDGVDGRTVNPRGPGRFTFSLRAPAPGAEVDVWFEGSFARRVAVRAGDRLGHVGPAELNPRRSATRVLTARAGDDATVRITVDRPGHALRPGWGDRAALWGAVSVTPHEPLAATRLERVAPADARDLCGRTVDWLELVPEA